MILPLSKTSKTVHKGIPTTANITNQKVPKVAKKARDKSTDGNNGTPAIAKAGANRGPAGTDRGANRNPAGIKSGQQEARKMFRRAARESRYETNWSQENMAAARGGPRKVKNWQKRRKGQQRRVWEALRW